MRGFALGWGESPGGSAGLDPPDPCANPFGRVDQESILAARSSSQQRRQTTSKPDQANKPTSAYRKRKARAAGKAAAGRAEEACKVQAMPVVNRQVAGIDIGGGDHWVCVGFTSSDDPDLVKRFPTYTQGRRDIAGFLHLHGVTTVAMEASGIYWIPLFEMLVKEGFEVLLVDPSYTRQLRGRPKTDKRDAQWIFRLHSVGLLQGAFRPDERTAVLRNDLRQRGNLIRFCGRHIQHMHKALEQMNLKLGLVLSDLTGLTGRKIIQAILGGERDPMKLAELRNHHCRADIQQIAQALDGTYRDEHVFALQQAYRAWEFYQGQIDEVDKKVAQQLEAMKSSKPLPPLPDKPPKTKKANSMRFDVRTALYYVTGVDLTELEGLDEASALTLISEIGLDMSKFPSVKHFCSWLGLCPNWKKTGGKVKSSRTRPGSNRAAQILRLVASNLHSSKGALGAFLRRMKGRLGLPAAITAAAHKLARMVYYSLKHGIQYVRKSQEEYEQQMHQKQIANLRKKARQLGLEVVEKASAPAQGNKGEEQASQEQRAEARQGKKAEQGKGNNGGKAPSKKGGRAKAAK
jgi:transposase